MYLFSFNEKQKMYMWKNMFGLSDDELEEIPLPPYIVGYSKFIRMVEGIYFVKPQRVGTKFILGKYGFASYGVGDYETDMVINELKEKTCIPISDEMFEQIKYVVQYQIDNDIPF